MTMTFFTFMAQSIPSMATPPQPLPDICHFMFGNLEMHPTQGLPICTKAPPLGLEKYANSSPTGQDQNNNYTFVQ